MADFTERQQGIVDFVNKVSVLYRKHSALAVKEDILIAVAYFSIDPSAFYDELEIQAEVKAEAELYRLTGKVVD